MSYQLTKLFRNFYEQKETNMLLFLKFSDTTKVQIHMELISRIDATFVWKTKITQTELSMTGNQLRLAENKAEWQVTGSQIQYEWCHTLQSFT